MKLVLLTLLAATLPAFGGGFYLNVDDPSISSEAKAKGAFAVARLSGCNEAEKGVLQATAEGIVDGKRQSIPLKVVTLGTAGWFAVQRQWPQGGKWVVVLKATHPSFSMPTTTVVPVTGDKVEFAKASWENRRGLSNADIDRLLR